MGTRSGYIPLEAYEQRIVARYLDRSGLKWFHVPNGGFRAKATASALKAEGVKAGVPDILIITLANDGKPTAIELKRRKGGRVSKEQKEWIEVLTANGWECKVCKGADEAKEFIDERYK